MTAIGPLLKHRQEEDCLPADEKEDKLFHSLLLDILLFLLLLFLVTSSVASHILYHSFFLLLTLPLSPLPTLKQSFLFYSPSFFVIVVVVVCLLLLLKHQQLCNFTFLPEKAVPTHTLCYPHFWMSALFPFSVCVEANRNCYLSA